MTLKIAICEDNPNDLSLLKEAILRYSIKYNYEFELFCHLNGDELLSAYDAEGVFNIIFMDIEMPGMDGIEVSKKLRSISDYYCNIVFISSYPKYMHKSFRVQPYDFITKPFDDDDLFATLNRLIDEFTKNYPTRLTIPTGTNKFIVDISDLFYISTSTDDSNHLVFALKNNSITGKGSLNDWEKEAYAARLVRCHRSYIVNIQHIYSIDRTSITLDNGVTLPISRKYEKAVKELFVNKITNLLI